MKKIIKYSLFFLAISSTPVAFAQIAFNNNEIQISGAATTNQFQALTQGFTWNATTRIYELTHDIRLSSGADVRGINDLIIDLKGHNIHIDTGVVSAEFTDLTFMNSVGRAVGAEFWVEDNGGGSISFNNCQYIHNVEGNPGGGDQYLDVISISRLSNTTIKSSSSEFVEQEVDVEFVSSERISNLNLKRGGRIIVNGSTTRVFFINPTHFSRSANGGYPDIQDGASAMFLNYVPDKTLNRDLGLNGLVQEHWVYWLGTSVDNFQRTTPNTLVIDNRNDQLRNIAGGYRHYNFIGGVGAKAIYLEGTTKMPCRIDLNRADMLDTATEYILPADENFECVTRTARYGGDTTTPWTYTTIADQKIAVLKYGKKFIYIDVSTTSSSQVGSPDSPAPFLVEDNENITESNETTVANYTSIDNLDQLYDSSELYLVNNYAGEIAPYITVDGTTLDLGSFNLVIDTTAMDVFAVDTGTNTITIKSTTLAVGDNLIGLTTTGTVSVTGSETLNFGYSHSAGRVKYLEVRGLTDSSVIVTDNTQMPVADLVSTTAVPGTDVVFRASFPAPTDESNTQILVTRQGFFSFAQLFPASNLTFITTPVFIPFVGLEQNQETMINNTLKLLQKTEAIRNTYSTIQANPMISESPQTVVTGGGTATLENQEKTIYLLNLVLSKVTAIREANRH